MAIPETQLDTWSHQGSIAQSSSTYATVGQSLGAHDTKYYYRNFDIFLQGSYGNDTNIYAESDVDIVICLRDVYYYDISELNEQHRAIFNASFTPATYAYSDYKADVIAALRKSFGTTDVDAGKKSIKIKASGNRRSADVVVATEFYRYFSTAYGMDHYSGICFFSSSGTLINNYPKGHSANCTRKHQETSGWFKPMVRILKNMRSRLVDSNAIEPGCAPSYFLEGLLYNIPREKFGKTYADTFCACMSWLLSAKPDEFVCPSERHYLVRENSPACWPRANYDEFIKASIDMWKNW
jgi:hypothetical protein